MFEPEYENLTCPKCHTREVYFDRQMGHYCMFCGRQFSTEEVEALLEQELCHIMVDEWKKNQGRELKHFYPASQ